MSIIAADDSVSDEIDVTFSANTGSGELPASCVIWSSSATYYAQDGHTGVITSNTSATTLIQSAISAISGSGGRIFLKHGTYNLGATNLQVNISNHVVSIIGEDEDNTIITGTGTYLLFMENKTGTTAWPAGYLEMENLYFNHNAPASGIGLYIWSGSSRLKNISLYNSNATKTGKIGIKTGPQNNSESVIWDSITVLNYGTGINSTIDHQIILNPTVSQTTEYAFLFGYNLHLLVLNPHVYLQASDGTACYGYAWPNGAGEQNLIVNPLYEPHSTLGTHTVSMFTRATGSRIVQVINPHIWLDAADYANINLSDNYTLIHFTNYLESTTAGKSKTTINYGYASVASAGTIAHELVTTPKVVQLTASGSNPMEFSYIPDATNITVYHTGSSARGIFWRAEV
jgi:hypothetical protein